MLRAEAGGVLIDILVVPRSSRARIGPVQGDRLKVAVTAPPVDGKANAAIIELLAKALERPKSAVEIVSGDGSRRKTVRVRGVDAETARARLAPADVPAKGPGGRPGGRQ